MRKVKILFPLVHDGKSYNKDDVVEMTTEQADRLIILNVAVFTKSSAKEQAVDNTENIGNLNDSDDEHDSSSDKELSDQEDTDEENKNSDDEINLNDVLNLEEPSSMTKEELEAELIAAGIEYPSRSNKADLIALVTKNRNE